VRLSCREDGAIKVENCAAREVSSDSKVKCIQKPEPPTSNLYQQLKFSLSNEMEIVVDIRIAVPLVIGGRTVPDSFWWGCGLRTKLPGVSPCGLSGAPNVEEIIVGYGTDFAPGLPGCAIECASHSLFVRQRYLFYSERLLVRQAIKGRQNVGRTLLVLPSSRKYRGARFHRFCVALFLQTKNSTSASFYRSSFSRKVCATASIAAFLLVSKPWVRNGFYLIGLCQILKSAHKRRRPLPPRFRVAPYFVQMFRAHNLSIRPDKRRTGQFAGVFGF
jgi:hypothetical protein